MQDQEARRITALNRPMEYHWEEHPMRFHSGLIVNRTRPNEELGVVARNVWVVHVMRSNSKKQLVPIAKWNELKLRQAEKIAAEVLGVSGELEEQETLRTDDALVVIRPVREDEMEHYGMQAAARQITVQTPEGMFLMPADTLIEQRDLTEGEIIRFKGMLTDGEQLAVAAPSSVAGVGQESESGPLEVASEDRHEEGALVSDR